MSDACDRERRLDHAWRASRSARVGELVQRVRAQEDGDRRVVVWNPSIAWHAPHADTLREQFAYITVDLPPQERSALGISDELLGRLRATVHQSGPAAAAALVPDSVMRDYAITGERDDVVAALTCGVTEIRPDLVAFGAHAYTTEFVSEIAELAIDAGLARPSSTPWAVCSENRGVALGVIT